MSVSGSRNAELRIRRPSRNPIQISSSKLLTLDRLYNIKGLENEPLLTQIAPGVKIYQKKNKKFVNPQMIEEEREYNPSLLSQLVTRSEKTIETSSVKLSQIVRSEAYRKLQRKYMTLKNSFVKKKATITQATQMLTYKISQENNSLNQLIEKVDQINSEIEDSKEEFYEIKRANYELLCDLDAAQRRNGRIPVGSGFREPNTQHIQPWQQEPIIDVDSMSYEQLLALEERVGRENVGLNAHAIKRLKRFRLSQKEATQTEEMACCICCEGIQPESRAIELECAHIFHEECLTKWLKVKRLCPLCKSQVTPQ